MMFSAWLHAASSVAASYQYTEEEIQKGPPILRTKTIAVDPGDNAIKKLQKELFNEALVELNKRYKLWVMAKGTTEQLVACGDRMLTAGLGVNEKTEDRTAFLKLMLEFSSYVGQVVVNRDNLKNPDQQVDRHLVAEFHLSVLILLEKEKKAGVK
jgi:hypothetical protein